MSVKGSNRIEYTACGSSTPMSPPSLESVGSGGPRRPRRSVRVSLEVGGGVGGSGGFFACLFRGWTRSESAGPAAGLRGFGSDRVSVHVGSYYSTPDDSNELSVVPVVRVQVPVSGPSSSERAAVLGAMWDQSRGLWTPAAPSTVARLRDGVHDAVAVRAPPGVFGVPSSRCCNGSAPACGFDGDAVVEGRVCGASVKRADGARGDGRKQHDCDQREL